jgi:hypothetical protein
MRQLRAFCYDALAWLIASDFASCSPAELQRRWFAVRDYQDRAQAIREGRA